MSAKLTAPCSLTKLFPGEGHNISGGFIDFPEPLVSLVYHYKSELQLLQLEIIDTIGSYDLEEIGHFEKLEIVTDLLIEQYAKKLIPPSGAGDSPRVPLPVFKQTLNQKTSGEQGYP